MQNFGSTDEIVEIASVRVTTLRAVIDLLEIGRQYTEWEAEKYTKLLKMQGGVT